MMNRLNRNVAFAMCLGGAALLTIGCADTDDTTAATTTATAETQTEENAIQAVDGVEDAAEEQAGTDDSVSLQSRRASGSESLDPVPPREDASPRQPERDRERDHTQRAESDGDLLFSPSESFETIAANLPDVERPRERSFATEPRVEVVPSLLDLGTMGTSETKSGTMTIRNISDEPVMIENSRTSCGCTVANVPRGQYIQPGESVDVDVSLRSSTRPQVLTKTVTFMIRDHPPVTARVRGEVVTYVTIEPGILNPDSFDEPKVVIKADDGQPFRITSVHPRIVAEPLSEEPATEHELTIAWDQWLELGEARRVLFYTDHPKATQVMATIRAPRQTPDRTAAARERQEQSQRRGPNPFALVLRGETEQLTELIKNEEIDLDARDRNGQTLLAVAAQAGNLDILDALIEAGIDVNTPDSVGRTPLMNAGQAKQPQVVKRLVEAGADLDVVDSTIGGTALAWTVAFGDAESAKLLIDAGADVNIPTEATGFTPLIWASGFGQTDSVNHLIKADADLEATDRTEGATALMHATRTGRVDNLRALIAAGANVEATDRSGKTALHLAAGSSSATVEAVRLLIDAGANVNTRDNAGLNALDHARGRTDANARAVLDYLESMIDENGE